MIAYFQSESVGTSSQCQLTLEQYIGHSGYSMQRTVRNLTRRYLAAESHKPDWPSFFFGTWVPLDVLGISSMTNSGLKIPPPSLRRARSLEVYVKLVVSVTRSGVEPKPPILLKYHVGEEGDYHSAGGWVRFTIE